MVIMADIPQYAVDFRNRKKTAEVPAVSRQPVSCNVPATLYGTGTGEFQRLYGYSIAYSGQFVRFLCITSREKRKEGGGTGDSGVSTGKGVFHRKLSTGVDNFGDKPMEWGRRESRGCGYL